MLMRVCSWLLPNTCPLCQCISLEPFCVSCCNELPWICNPCGLCARELTISSSLIYCGECLIDPPPFQRNVVLFHYRFPVTSLITKMKFQSELSYARKFGQLL